MGDVKRKEALRVSGKTHSRVIRGWIASTSRDSLPLFRFERVCNVKRRRSTMTIMALLQFEILSESWSPKTFLYRFLTSLIMGARLSRKKILILSTLADIQSARKKILHVFFNRSILRNARGQRKEEGVLCTYALCVSVLLDDLIHVWSREQWKK